MPKALSKQQKADLHADIRVRMDIQKAMSEHTRAVIELELGLSTSTIKKIESGFYNHLCPYKVNAEVRREVRRRRNIFFMGSEAMQAYSVEAIAERHGISGRTVEDHIRLVKNELVTECQRRNAA